MGLKENLKKSRIQKGYTLQKVADILGVSRSTLFKYESGEISNIPIENITKLADIYETTPNDLLRNMTIGENIRKIRKEKGLTQKELGERLGITQSAIGQFENDKTCPTVITILRIADALNVEFSDITGKYPTTNNKDINDWLADSIHIDGKNGIIAILEDIYGKVEENEVTGLRGCTYYYTVGENEKQFIIYEGNIDTLYDMVKSIIPIFLNAVKEERTEEEVLEEISKELNNTENFPILKDDD